MESQQTLFFLVCFLLGPPISLHNFALTTSLVLQNSPCVQPIVVCFLPISVELWGVRNRMFRPKRSQANPSCVKYLARGITKNIIFSCFFLLGPPMSLHIFDLKTSLVLQDSPCVQPICAFFFQHRFTCLAYLGGLSFDLCECFTLFNDEASNFFIFFPKTAKAVCDVCNAKKSSQRKTHGSGETNKPKVCNADTQ